jgi:uncharacterized protein YgiB involved in biofilm formation
MGSMHQACPYPILLFASGQRGIATRRSYSTTLEAILNSLKQRLAAMAFIAVTAVFDANAAGNDMNVQLKAEGGDKPLTDCVALQRVCASIKSPSEAASHRHAQTTPPAANAEMTQKEFLDDCERKQRVCMSISTRKQ